MKTKIIAKKKKKVKKSPLIGTYKIFSGDKEYTIENCWPEVYQSALLIYRDGGKEDRWSRYQIPVFILKEFSKVERIEK